jgi:hypothetical protein
MGNKGIFMTQTTQLRSWASLGETDKDLTLDKPKAEDDRELILQLFDNLNTLYEKLNKLDYLLQRKNIERILYQKNKGEKNEN